MNEDQALWLSEHEACSAQYLVEVSGLSAEELAELIENGVIAPVNEAVQPQAFSLSCVVTVKRARRLRDDFELDRHGLALALTLMRRIEELEGDLQALQARLVHRR